METRRDVFQAIADPTRREIIHLISRKPLNVNALSGNFDMSRPAISQHVKILVECGLITIQRQGRERLCEPRLEKLAAIADWVEPYRKFWAGRLDRIDHLLRELQQPKKTRKRKK